MSGRVRFVPHDDGPLPPITANRTRRRPDGLLQLFQRLLSDMGKSLANDFFQLQQLALEVHSARIAAAQPGSKQFVFGRWSVSDKFPKAC